jgi:hypothetical protein
VSTEAAHKLHREQCSGETPEISPLAVVSVVAVAVVFAVAVASRYAKASALALSAPTTKSGLQPLEHDFLEYNRPAHGPDRGEK